MKKIFTLMTLLLFAMLGVNATVYETYSVSLGNGATQSPDGSTFFNVNAGGGYNTGYTGTYGGTSYTKGLKMNSKSSITFTTTVKSDITIVMSTAKNADKKFKLGGQSVAHENGSITINETSVSYTMTENSTDKYKEFVFTDVPATKSLAITNDGETGILFVKVEYTEENTVPSFSATVPNDKLTLKAAPSPFPATDAQGTFTLSGANLTAGTYNFTIPSVSGTLAVSPTQITVGEDGTISPASFTVTYTGPGTDVTATDANITATINEIEVTIPVNYRAMAALIEQTTVSTAKTWDFTKTVGADRAAIDADIVLANYDEFTFPEGFDATALVVSSSPNMNVSGAFRLGKLKLTTAVSGTLTFDFSDTGNKSGSGEGTKRYLKINGTNTEHYSNRQEGDDSNKNHRQTGKEVHVNAGEITIESSTSYLALYSVSFTPDTEIDITPAYDKSTYVTTSALDFSSVSGLKAYRASAAANGSVTLEEVGAVPSGTPLLLIGTKDTKYTVPVAASASAPGTNLLVAGDGTTTFDGTTHDYLLADDGLFYQISSGSIAVGKAYLHCASDPKASASRSLDLNIGGGGATGIETIKVGTDDNVYYDLQGRRVLYPTKGLYIVNGKKVVIK